MTKPVIRYRSGKWVCRGGGHKGSGRTVRAAYSAWIVAGSVGDAAYMGYETMRRKA